MTPRRKKGAGEADGHIGNRIRLHRMALGMSQEGLGEALGVSFQQVQKYEKGINRLSLAGAIRLCKVLKMTMAELTGEIGGKSAELVDPATFKLIQAFQGLSDNLKVPFAQLINKVIANGK